MTITATIVLFAVIWFMLLLMALPMRMKSQRDTGEVVAGTPASAPDNPMMGRKLFWVTVVTVALWVPLCLFIEYGPLTVDDIDFLKNSRESFQNKP